MAIAKRGTKAATKKPAKAAKPAAKKPAKAAQKPAKAPAVIARDDDARRAELLAAIVANPDDKRPRLIYADYLQERDDARGEFVALQCARAELAADDPRAAELVAREDELLARHKKAWTAFGDTKGARWEYRRGFIEKASLDCEALARHGATLFASEPIEELNVWKIDRHAAGLAPVLALPLHFVRRLSIARSRLAVRDWTALATATTLGRVELLDASVTALGETEGAMAAFAAATSLPALRELRMNGAYLGSDDLVALAGARGLRIARLVATNNQIGAEGLAALVEAPWVGALEHLDLSSNESIRLEGLEVLAGATRLTGLRSLRLDYAGIWSEGDAVVDLVLESPILSRLERLDLSQNLDAAQRARLAAALGDRFVG